MTENKYIEHMMPDTRFARLWDSIVVDHVVKDRLFRSAVLILALRRELRFETTALHGLLLLHGPPGTGKTTLARGLAQELVSVAQNTQARLIEIDSHKLMSSEHGESQKAVTQLFSEDLPRLCDDGIETVVVLDEVESVAVARSEASLAANPADVHRATDAVLASLDSNAAQIPNLLFVATSNFLTALDEAFLSRVDLQIHVPPPDLCGIVAILKQILLSYSTTFAPLDRLAYDPNLHQVAKILEGADGRRIRKSILEGMIGRIETAEEPSRMSINDLINGANRVMQYDALSESQGQILDEKT